jgi:tetratricopeptide (TPR) repeat protein
MQRCSRARFVRFLVAIAATAALTGSASTAEPTAGDAGAAPRPLMRLPAWIESISRPESPAKPALPPEAPSATVLTGGWTELADEAAAKMEAKADGSAGADPTTKTPLGPEASVLADENATAPAAAAEPTDVEVQRTKIAVETRPAAAEPDKVAEPAEERQQAASAAPVPRSPAEAPTLAIDPASFRGVMPGKTTREEIETSWGPGEAFLREDDAKGLFWVMEPFERVEVTLADQVVDSVRIKLAEPVSLRQLATQMEIGDLRTVSILDENGVSIGEVFPERGVVISVKPGTQTAIAVLLEPLDPEPFVLRAEGEIDHNSAAAVADLQYAIEVDPRHVRAHRLLLALLSEQGRWQQALAVAEVAEKLDSVDIWTLLKHAEALLALGRADEARAKIEGVRGLESVPPLVTAQTARLLGRVELAAEPADYQKSVAHFEEAIRKATPLGTNQSKGIQKAAREVLLDAHLGTALAIARGTWQQKGRVIPKWITRSEAIVSDIAADSPDRARLELELCRGALAAAASCAEGVESLPWVKRLLETREQLDTQIKDPARRRQIDWEVGLGLADAIDASLKRSDASDMLENATLTAAYLERGAEQRELTDADRRTLGDLLFRIGILHSLQQGAHATAVTWFDKVVPLWEGNSTFQEQGELGRLGESFVSMAISYWQVERRDDALTLSRKGVDLMVEAVDQEQLAERSLAVPYGNLSTMYAEQGNDEQSKTYAEMASRAEAAETRLR